MNHRSTLHPLWALAVGLTLGCGPMIVLEGETDDADESSGGGPSTVTTPMTTSPPPPPPTATDTGSLPPIDDTTTGLDTETLDGMSFITAGDDGPPPDLECDLWAQDCPEGEKCMPWANDGGNSWNATRCSPIAEEAGGPGDPCTVEGNGLSGIDTCELGTMCWDVDPATNEGHCVSLCVGSPEAPMCDDPSTSCVITSSPPALCIPNCDPIAQDCAEGEACYFVGSVFSCVPDASGEMGAPGDACEYINACDPGNFCAQAEVVPDCMGAAGCCSPFCAVDDPMPPCLPGQICTPFFQEGDAPEGYELVGGCVLP